MIHVVAAHCVDDVLNRDRSRSVCVP
jgi:hypothetical protein